MPIALARFIWPTEKGKLNLPSRWEACRGCCLSGLRTWLKQLEAKGTRVQGLGTSVVGDLGE